MANRKKNITEYEFKVKYSVNLILDGQIIKFNWSQNLNKS